MTFLARKFPLKYILAQVKNLWEKKTNYWYYYTAYSQIICATVIKPWPNGKSLTPNTIKRCSVIKHFTVWPPCLMMFELHQVFDQTT